MALDEPSQAHTCGIMSPEGEKGSEKGVGRRATITKTQVERVAFGVL